MDLLGPDGKPIDFSKAKVIGEKEESYEAGGLLITWGDTPEKALNRSLEMARNLAFQSAGQASLEKTGSHAVANEAAVKAMANTSNPFQFEPGASAVFMLLSREISYRDSLIAFLCEKIGIDKDELPKPSWPDPKVTEAVEDEKKEFDETAAQLSNAAGPEVQN